MEKQIAQQQFQLHQPTEDIRFSKGSYFNGDESKIFSDQSTHSAH
jgi:hypothetical protein